MLSRAIVGTALALVFSFSTWADFYGMVVSVSSVHSGFLTLGVN
jgi:hypothetical protein